MQNSRRQRCSGFSAECLPALQDGERAIAYITGSGEFADRDVYPLPDLLVLDLKMPRKSGHDVLAWLQTQATRLVTVVFSGSDCEQDLAQSRALGARKLFCEAK